MAAPTAAAFSSPPAGGARSDEALATLIEHVQLASTTPREAREPYGTLAIHLVSLAVGRTVTDVAAVARGKGEGQPLPQGALSQQRPVMAGE